MKRSKVLALIFGAAAVLVLASAASWADSYWLLVGFEVLQLAALAQAWSIMTGQGGLVSMAVNAFMGLGSYATAEMAVRAGWGIIPSIAAGGAMAVIFALVVAVPMFRFRGLYFTIGSLVLAQALGLFMSNYNGFGGNQGIQLVNDAPSDKFVYLFSLALAVAATLTGIFLGRAKLGLGLRSIRDDEDVAERVGVTTFRVKLFAFTVSALIMGLAGGIQAQRTGYIEPSGAFTLGWSINTINAAIIGGVGTVLGPIFGAVISIGLAEKLANFPELHLAIIGVFLIAIIRLAPEGLWGSALTLYRKRFTKQARKNRSGEVEQKAVHEAPKVFADRPKKAVAVAGEVLLEGKGVGKTFGGVRAVDSVDVQLRAGEVLGVIGPNGAGKSTLIGLLSGAISGEGRTILLGNDVTEIGAQGRARGGIGRTHQVPRPFGRMTVLENLMVAQTYGAGANHRTARAECERILHLCGLSEYADVKAAELGLLRLKRLELARALAVEPRILLLDEIGAGLVESEVRELIELIRSLRDEVDAILIVEHVLDVIRECCDRVVVLDGGKLLTGGTPAGVLADPEVAAVYLGTSGGREVRAERGALKDVKPLLEVKGIKAQYGAFHALHDVSFSIGAGEVVALLGTNGAGKTTTARALSGMMPVTGGEIWFDGERIDGLPAHEIVRRGITHSMEGRRIFADLSVEENLLLGGRTAANRAELMERLGKMYELFSALKDKRTISGASLSGGQQQMLAIGRALMAAPRLIIFDEISLGLAPIMVDRLYDALAEINGTGVTMIVIEQNVERGLALADRVSVLEKGRVALAGVPSDIRTDPRLLSLYVGEHGDGKEISA